MKSICVYCGASLGFDSIYGEVAKSLGRYLAENSIKLIYGGSDLGLMGIVANSVLANKGKVTAIMPLDLKNRGGHDNESELIVVDTMHQRKQKMFDLSDAFIVLPGGFGTLDEIFEMLTWKQLGYHRKPCGFLNVNGYFDYLFSFLDHTLGQGFIRPVHREMAFATDNISDLINQFLKLNLKQGGVYEKI